MTVKREHFDTRIWVEDLDGNLIPVKNLPGLDPDARIIEELSNYLVLDTWVFRFRFQRHLGTELILLCKCHSDTLHQGLFLPNTILGAASSDKKSSRNNPLYQRLTTELWDCILLYDSKDGRDLLHHLLIIEWNGTTAQRIGTITVTAPHESFHNLPKRGQRVRLG